MSSQLLDNLCGLLPIGEKRKILNHFIEKSVESDVNDVLENFKDLPSTQYNLVKLLLADKFRRFDLMIELLYDGDSAVISGTVSKRWLYEGDENSLTDCEFLLDKLFPNVSYSCRRKILHKMGKCVTNEAKADQIWNAVEQRYGFDSAFPLLQACSKAKISSVIAHRNVTLSGYQLVQILQKYPDIGLDYLKKNSVTSSKMNPNCSPLHYLYENRPDDFLDLCINHSDKVRQFGLGRNRSTKLIRAYHARLMQHPKKTSLLLKLDRIQREFPAEEFQTLFESALPNEPIPVGNMWKWVSTVPLSKRTEMVNQAFMNVFQINLTEHPRFMNAEYIFLMPEEQRLSFIEWKSRNEMDLGCDAFKVLKGHYYTTEENKLAWLALKPAQHSVPELQNLLLIEQNVVNRARLSQLLIKTCYINEDLPQLLNVLKLLNKRSRNDQSNVRWSIFNSLSEVMTKMEFSKEAWDIIIEMLHVSLVFDDTSNGGDIEKEQIVGKCLAFHLESKLPLDNLVTMHIKLKIQSGSTSCANPYVTNATDRRVLLELYVKELENLELTKNLCGYDGMALKDHELKEFIIEIVEDIKKFNDETNGDLEPILVSSHPWLISNFEKIAKEEEGRIDKHFSVPRSRFSWERGTQLMNIIQWLRKKQNLILDAFNGSDYLHSRMLLYSPGRPVVLHYLRTNPTHLVQNWSASLSKMLETASCAKLMRTLRFWNYSTLLGQSVNKCVEIISETSERISEESIKRKCNAVLVLSILKEPTDFLKLVAEFYPTEGKVDVLSKTADKDYHMRQAFAKSLINVTVPHLTFEAINKFCVGDYLKLTLGAMYSQLSRASSVKSLDFLRVQLTTVRISLQKHIIRLYFTIGSMDDKFQTLKHIESSNVSIRYVVFLQASNLFRSSQCQATWITLKTIMERTSADDTLIIDYLLGKPSKSGPVHSRRRFRRTKSRHPNCAIPLEFISEYIDACLILLRRLDNPSVPHFILMLESIMEKIPGKTLDEILMHDFENQDTFSSTYCAKYLQCSSSESILEHRLSNMWRILNNVIERGWAKKTTGHSGNTFDYPTMSLVLTFISSLCSDTRDPSKAWLQIQIYRTLLEKFKALSTRIFFKEILYLELASLIVAEAEHSGIVRVRRIGHSLAQFVDSLVEGNGGEMIFIAKDTIKCYVNRCLSAEFQEDNGMIVELVDAILETSKTRQNKIISLSLIHNVVVRENLTKTLEKINGILNESNDVIVQTFFASITH